MGVGTSAGAASRRWRSCSRSCSRDTRSPTVRPASNRLGKQLIQDPVIFGVEELPVDELADDLVVDQLGGVEPAGPRAAFPLAVASVAALAAQPLLQQCLVLKVELAEFLPALPRCSGRRG